MEYLVTYQPAIGTLDQPRLIYLAPGSDLTDKQPDINEDQKSPDRRSDVVAKQP